MPGSTTGDSAMNKNLANLMTVLTVAVTLILIASLVAS